MTSTVRVYRNTDTSAPTLTGQVGSLTTLLDAVLVNGYGSSTAAGWTIGQTTTNKRQYINSATDGTGFGLWVDDAASGTGGAKEARVTGFESMSGLGVGSGQFPTSGQIAIGTTPAGAMIIRKSTTADATARNWTIVADNTCFYLFTETGDYTSPMMTMAFMFGDIFSYKTSDAYRCAILGGRNLENSNSQSQEMFPAFAGALGVNQFVLTASGHYIARSWTGVGGSVQCNKVVDAIKFGIPNTSNSVGNSGTSAVASGGNSSYSFGANYPAPSFFPYPNGPDGGLYLSPTWLVHSNAIRGYYKGLWCPLHHLPLNHNDTYSGSGNMSGKTFLVQNILHVSSNSAVPAQVHIEISNTWA